MPGLLTLKKKKEFALKRKDTKPSEKRTTKETSEILASIAREKSVKARAKMTPKKEPKVQRIDLGAQHHVNKILNSKDVKTKKKDSYNQLYMDRSNSFRDKLKKALEAEKINKLRFVLSIRLSI